MNENTWEVAVLKCLVDLGYNHIELQDIYGKIKGSEYVNITPDLETVKYGNQPYYYDYVRSTLKQLVKKGHAERVNIGIYSITDEGIERLKCYQGKICRL